MKELVESIKQYLSIKNEISQIQSIVVPEFPKTQISYTIKEWNDYIVNKQGYDKAVNLKGDKLKELSNQQSDLKVSIIGSLPKRNTWFILKEKDFHYAVGSRSNDWPTSPGDLLLIENPVREELQEIKHQVIN